MSGLGSLAGGPGSRAGCTAILAAAVLAGRSGRRCVVPVGADRRGTGRGGSGGGLAVEARQAMDNIGGVLRGNGLSFADVFKCTVILTDMTKWAEFNGIYLSYFNGLRLPARSAIGANALALGVQVEVECTASFPAMPRAITARRSPPVGPYSTAVATGGLVFVSGVVRYDPVARVR